MFACNRLEKQFIVFLVLISCVIGIFPSDQQNSFQESAVFSETSRIKLAFKDEVFAYIIDIDPLDKGYVLLLNQSAYGNAQYILKLDENGEIVGRYAERGNGPGMLRMPGNIVVTEDFILVSERSSPWIHWFDHDLNFVKDTRIKMQGLLYDLGKYYGIWHLHALNEGLFMLALYRKADFKFLRCVFKIKERPANVYTWGGLCRINENKFAGVYVSEYQIRLYDREFTFLKNLLPADPPNHIKEYFPLKGYNNTVNDKTFKWMRSWSKMHGIYYTNNQFLLMYRIDQKMYLDIYSQNGKAIKLNLLISKGASYYHFDGEIFLKLLSKPNEDDGEYWIQKLKYKGGQK